MKEKALEAKIVDLERKFKTVASLCQVIDSRVTSRVEASTFALNIYMFGTS